LGVVPDTTYFMTRNDVLQHNVDLIAAAAQMLAGMDTQTLRVRAAGGSPVQQLSVEAQHIDRVDVLVDGRPVLSYDVTAPTDSVTLPAPAPAGSTLTCNGYRAGTLVVSTRLHA
jgi:hypothetical protein